MAEIRMFAGNFNPMSWLFCNGALVSIAQNTALFSLLGTTTVAMVKLLLHFPTLGEGWLLVPNSAKGQACPLINWAKWQAAIPQHYFYLIYRRIATR